MNYLRAKWDFSGIFSHTDVGSSAGRAGPILILNGCNPAGWQTINSEHGPSPFLCRRKSAERKSSSLYGAELFSWAAKPAGTSRCCTWLFTLPGLAGPTEQRNNGALSGLCRRARYRRGRHAGSSVDGRDEHSDLLAMLHYSTPPLWETALFFRPKSTLAG